MACYRFTPPKTNKNANPPEKLVVWGRWFSPWQLCFRSTAESRREVASDEEDFEERVPGQDVRFQNLGLFGGSSQLHLGGGFKYLYFHPYLGKISNLANIFQRG